MANIKSITDSEGVGFYPRTHTKAVVDDNGYTVESRLQATEDIVNQAQLEIGAVPSDLTPTYGSTNWVTSGGVYNALENATEEYVDIDLSSLTEQNCSLGSTAWFMNTSTNAQRHKAIPVVEGEIYSISRQNDGNCQIAWLSSSYAPPYSNNNPLPLATGQTGRIVTKGQLVVPEGASFLAFTTVDGNGVVYDIVLKKRSNKYDTLSEEIDKLESFEKGYTTKTSLSELFGTEVDYYISTTTYKWSASTTYTGKLFVVSKYKGYEINVAKTTGACRFAFLRNNTITANTTPSYCIGYSKYVEVSTSETVTYRIPDDCNYMYVYTNSNGTDVTPFITFIEPLLESVTSDSFNKISDVDLTSLIEQDCSLGSDSWFMNTSTLAQRHIALSVQQGEVYRLTSTTGGWWGYLTSAYSPPYSNSDAIPYVEGTNRMPRQTNYMVKIPKGCAYLALTTVDGSGNVVTWTVEKGEAITKVSLPVPVKLRLAHWNVGHFTYYDGAQGNSTPNIPTTLVDVPYTTKFNQGKFNDDGTTTSSNYYVYSRYIRYSGNISLSEGFVIENLIRCNISENTFTSESVGSQSLAFTVNDGEYIRLNIKKSSSGTILPTDSIISSLTIKKPKNEWMKERYRTVINNVDADILCVCEDDPVFDAAGTTSLSAIYSCYNTKIQGTKYNYICASVYSNLPATNMGNTMYAQTIQANRYFKTTLFELNGKNVYIVETHFDWNQNSNGPAYRASQIQQVITAFADKDYVVISGDFNINTLLESTEMQPFIDAGYKLANGGYMGFLRTSRELAHIDHICAKGFSISNIKLYEESLDLSDHCLISCELTML